MKDLHAHPDGRDTQGKVCGEGRGRPLSSRTMPPFVRVFTNAPRAPCLWRFCGIFLTLAQSIMNSVSSPSSLAGGREMGLKAPDF